jgi:hypothetical protein
MSSRAIGWSIAAFFACCAIGGFLIGYVGPAEAKQDETPYVPQVIPSPQEHAWCYVLVNDQNKLVGDIHTLSCVPRAT